MSNYIYCALNDKPCGLWMLDRGSSPFKDSSSYLNTASMTGTLKKELPLVAGSNYAVEFDSTNTGTMAVTVPVYTSGQEMAGFTMEAWVSLAPKVVYAGSDQVIMGSTGNVDGLILNDRTVKFRLKYTTSSDAEVSYTMPVREEMHIVGVYDTNMIRLYINGNLVDTTLLNDDQKANTFLPISPGLASGANAGASQAITMNGLALYPSILSPDQISNHYVCGLAVPTAASVLDSFGGTRIEAERDNADIALLQSWTNDEWNQGYIVDCAINKTGQLVPSMNDTGLTIAGTWQDTFTLDPPTGHSLYGVVIDWDGLGVTVDTSLDSVVWTNAQPGVRITNIPPTFDTTNQDLFLRITFAAGLTEAYVNSMTVTSFKTGSMFTKTSRSIVIGGPTTINARQEPFTCRDDAGLYMQSGSVNIGLETDASVPASRTIELWGKRLTGANVNVTVNGATFSDPINGTKYINGKANSGQPDVGDWFVIHMVCSADITTQIVISHTGLILTNIVLYPTALTSTEVGHIFDLYTGDSGVAVNDDSTIGISEYSTPVDIYTYDWAITGAG